MSLSTVGTLRPQSGAAPIAAMTPFAPTEERTTSDEIQKALERHFIHKVIAAWFLLPKKEAPFQRPARLEDVYYVDVTYEGDSSDLKPTSVHMRDILEIGNQVIINGPLDMFFTKIGLITHREGEEPEKHKLNFLELPNVENINLSIPPLDEHGQRYVRVEVPGGVEGLNPEEEPESETVSTSGNAMQNEGRGRGKGNDGSRKDYWEWHLRYL